MLLDIVFAHGVACISSPYKSEMLHSSLMGCESTGPSVNCPTCGAGEGVDYSALPACLLGVDHALVFILAAKDPVWIWIPEASHDAPASLFHNKSLAPIRSSSVLQSLPQA